MNRERFSRVPNRRRTSLIVAVVMSLMALAGPAGAASDNAVDVGNAPWADASTSYSITLGRSWS